MKPDWSAVIVVAPTASTGSSLKGDGWTLEPKPAGKIVPGTRKATDLILVSGSQVSMLLIRARILRATDNCLYWTRSKSRRPLRIAGEVAMPQP